jgi:hypothetical protein
MGKDGSQWKHGYIPENGAADALKAHKKPGGKGSKRTVAPKIRTTAAPRAMAASERGSGTRGAGIKAPKRTSAPKIVNPSGRNTQDLSVPKDIASMKTKPKKAKVDLGKLPPGFGNKSTRKK